MTTKKLLHVYKVIFIIYNKKMLKKLVELKQLNSFSKAGLN